MKSNCSYPHPVLGNQDDVEGVFDVECRVAKTDSGVSLEVEIKLENDAIRDLIESDSARFQVCWDCSRTYSRGTVCSKNSEVSVSISLEKIMGAVDISCSIVAVRDLPGYRHASMNEEYGEAVFKVVAGQYLAIAEVSRFDPDTDYDPLRNQAASLIKIAPGVESGEPYWIDFESDRIIVHVPDDSWGAYCEIGSLLPSTIHAAVAVPALVEAIRKIQGDLNGSQYGDYVWYQRLQMIMDQEDYGGAEDPIETAQRIIDSPLGKSFAELDARLHDDGGGDEE